VAKFASKTKVMINGLDVTPYVFKASLPRIPGAVEHVELTLQIDELEVESDGTLVIHINTEE
jgi:hypothetical protein